MNKNNNLKSKCQNFYNQQTKIIFLFKSNYLFHINLMVQHQNFSPLLEFLDGKKNSLGEDVKKKNNGGRRKSTGRLVELVVLWNSGTHFGISKPASSSLDHSLLLYKPFVTSSSPSALSQNIPQFLRISLIFRRFSFWRQPLASVQVLVGIFAVTTLLVFLFFVFS